MKSPVAIIVLLLGATQILAADHPGKDTSTEDDSGSWLLKHRCELRKSIYPHGQRFIVTEDPDSRTVRLWNQESGTMIQSLGTMTGRIENGQAIVAKEARIIALWNWQTVWIWKRGQTKPIAEFEVQEDRMTLSQDGSTLAFWTAPAHKISIYDTQTGTLTGQVPHTAGALRAVALSPDGSMLASVGMGKQLLIWERKDEEDDPSAKRNTDENKARLVTDQNGRASIGYIIRENGPSGWPNRSVTVSPRRDLPRGSRIEVSFPAPY